MATLYRHGVRRIDLAPLDTDSITDYLVAEGRVPRARAARTAVVLRDRTGGNPFYLRETWRYALKRRRTSCGFGVVR